MGGGRATPGDTGYGQGNAGPSMEIGGGSLERPTFSKSVPGATYAPGTPLVNSGTDIGYYQTPDSFMYSGGRVSPTTSNSNAPKMVPVTTMEPLIQQWAYSQSPADQAKYKAIVQQMQQAKLVTDKGTPALSSVIAAWSQVLTGATFNTQYSPIEYLGILAQQGATNITGSNPDGTQGPTTNTDTSVSRDVTLTNKFDAHRIVDNALGQYLGRRATESELAEFRAMLRSEEKSNPIVSKSTRTSTTTPDGEGNSTSSSSNSGLRSGGTNPDQIAKEYAQSRGEYAETQSATTGMRWLSQAIADLSQERMI